MTGRYLWLSFLRLALAAAGGDSSSDAIDLVQVRSVQGEDEEMSLQEQLDASIQEQLDEEESVAIPDDYDLDAHYDPNIMASLAIDTTYGEQDLADAGHGVLDLLELPTTTKRPGIIAGEDLETARKITQVYNKVMKTSGHEYEVNMPRYEAFQHVTESSKKFLLAEDPTLPRDQHALDLLADEAITTGGVEQFYYYYDVSDDWEGDGEWVAQLSAVLHDLEDHDYPMPGGQTADQMMAGDLKFAAKWSNYASTKSTGGFANPVQMILGHKGTDLEDAKLKDAVYYPTLAPPVPKEAYAQEEQQLYRGGNTALPDLGIVGSSGQTPVNHWR